MGTTVKKLNRFAFVDCFPVKYPFLVVGKNEIYQSFAKLYHPINQKVLKCQVLCVLTFSCIKKIPCMRNINRLKNMTCGMMTCERNNLEME